MNPILIAALSLLGIIALIIGYIITEDFWNVHYLKKDWYRCVFKGKNKKMRPVWLKPDRTDASGMLFVHYKGGTYPIEEEAQVTSGTFNVPTLYFLEGVFTPLILAATESEIKDKVSKIKAKGHYSPEQIEAMRKWHIFTDIMNAIDEDPISQTWMLAIICGVVILSCAALYYVLGNRIDDAVFPLLPTPIPTPVLGSGS